MDTINQHIQLIGNPKTQCVEQLNINVNDNKHLDTNPDSVFSNAPKQDIPDPLSFFDNLSNVSATFQSFTQPLASFFNNSTNLPADDLVELPNQILVEETNAYYDCKTQNLNSSSDKQFEEIISYENFKSDAISNIPIKNNKNEDLKNKSENNFFFDDQVYVNSAYNSNFIENKESLISDEKNLPSALKNKLETDLLIDDSENISNHIDKFQIYQENTPFVFEVKPEIVAYTKEEENIRNSENNQIIEKNEILQSDNSEIEIEESFKFQGLQEKSIYTKEYIREERNILYPSSALDADNSVERIKQLQQQLDCQCERYALQSSQLRELEMKYSILLTDFRKLKTQKEDNGQILLNNSEVQNDLSKLREDLQCHLQTIGFLVAEKTELSSLLSDTQLSLENENLQRLDLTEKMKKMVEFYSNLEKEIDMIKSEKNTLYSSKNEYMRKFNNMHKDYNKLKHQHDEILQDFLESKEQIKSFTERNINLEKDLEQLRGQLSLANIKIQQLTLDESIKKENQLDKLMQEKFESLKQISFLNDTLKIVSEESKESGMQYQQYAEQLNLQIRNLAGKLEHYQKENEEFRIQADKRIKHIGHLEKQLQNIENDNSQQNSNMLKREIDAAMETAERLQAEKEDLNASLTKALIEKELIQEDLDSCKFSISQFESTIEQLRGSQPDNAVLLATMESEKVAASRAISQNKELKSQMECMQEVLLKVNNDNVQLTENVSVERKTNKDLFEKLQRTEISLQTFAEAIEIKDKELVNLREELERTYREVVQQEQLSHCLKHEEADDYSSSSLQKELQDAKHMIVHLTNELNTLRQNQLNQTLQINQTIEVCKSHQDTQTGQNPNIDETISTTSYAVSDLKSQLISLQIRNSELESLLHNLRTNETKRTDTNGNESLDRETAMKHLEKKFLRTMEQLARLTEEKQRLEHLVLQLQGETETIGEYVSLYQQQRSILKQRALEKDHQLQQLTNDRETIKASLDRLNSLVNKLIIEKGAITKDLMKQHEHFRREHDELCDEHQKIHQEINKITGDGFMTSEVNDNANTEIAAEIMCLLSEIKSSNLVQPAEVIHHCPWCSGKLLTV